MIANLAPNELPEQGKLARSHITPNEFRERLPPHDVLLLETDWIRRVISSKKGSFFEIFPGFGGDHFWAQKRDLHIFNKKVVWASLFLVSFFEAKNGLVFGAPRL